MPNDIQTRQKWKRRILKYLQGETSTSAAIAPPLGWIFGLRCGTRADDIDIPVKAQHSEDHENRTVLGRALARLKPRERELLWLAYVEGSSHREISEVSGLKENSIRPLLLRARRKLASLLRGGRAHA